MNNEKLILERIELFIKVYSEYEIHLNPIPSRLLKSVINELEKDNGVDKNSILFTLGCLKESSFCNHTSNLMDNPFYLNNLINLFNSRSYNQSIYNQDSDENVIRKILSTLLFLQSYEFKLNFGLTNYIGLSEGLCENYEFFLRELDYINFPKYEIDYMRRYLGQFGLHQIPPTCFVTKVFTKGDVIRLHFDYSTAEYKKSYFEDNPTRRVDFSYYFPQHVQKFRTR